ncbi:hypothetical protein [Blastococcus sp. TF02A-35]|uniref:hypothetical protein n=1 Tax=Blastococcus sp. TF02A-35 TaxID=2559612 RepID=UPI001073EC1C|nr:hypothetical protein [Blastococcus sp. TF02A_35]TFV46567.1 hypothetical protein E4P43_16330 [Blastococcus sp. TF02A_35]
MADGTGLHRVSPHGRTTTWRRGPGGPATAWTFPGGEARSVGGRRTAGPLLVVGDDAGAPLVVVPVAEWSAVPPPERGGPLRGTGLQRLVDVLGLDVRPAGEDEVATLASVRVPVARALPRWTGWQSAVAVLGAVPFAVGHVLGVARGSSSTWAAVGLLGLVVLLAAGAGPLATGLLGERLTSGSEAVVRPDRGARRVLLARRPHGPEVGIREGDGVERWLPVGEGRGAVAAVRTGPHAVELVDDRGAVVQSLHAERFAPGPAAREALDRLWAAAGLPVRAGRSGARERADLGSDLPTAGATWPPMLPRPRLLAVLGVGLAGLDGLVLLLAGDGMPAQRLGAGYLAVAVGSGLLWLRLRRPGGP